MCLAVGSELRGPSPHLLVCTKADEFLHHFYDGSHNVHILHICLPSIHFVHFIVVVERFGAFTEEFSIDMDMHLDKKLNPFLDLAEAKT